jgi:2-oxoglutarate ferredoxin oxidoreductase subunit alpha
LMARLKRKIMDSSDNLPVPLFREEKECEVGIVYYGSMENIIQEIDDILEETGRKVSQCRVRALPLHSEVKEFMERHETIIVLEVNRDGQLNGIMRKEMPTGLLTRIHSVAYSDGLPPRATQYAEMILAVLEEVGA